jgi:curved DNA-binding protein CbpA
MTDYFALLGEPRRPWLDPGALKKKFMALSGEVHPDRTHGTADPKVGTAAFAELNAAYNCLRDPKERLRHLLELERGTKPTDLQQIPPDLAELFIHVAALCRKADQFLGEKAKASSPLLQAQLFERGQEWFSRFAETLQTVNRHQDALMSRVRAVDEAWPGGARENLLQQLEDIWRLLGFYNRWANQIRERMAQISF